jgi:hypothetical protein
MNKHLLTTGFTTLFVVSITLTQPKLSIDKPEIDLGTIYSGMKKQGKIVLKNIGTDTLRIFSVQPSCGCTAVKQPKQFLLPNESDVAEVEFNSAGYRGHVEKHINITSNDPLSQNLSMKLIAEVKEEIRPVNGSSLVWFGTLNVGVTSEKQVSLVNSSDHPIKITNYSVSSPSVTAKLIKKALQPNDTLDVKITIKPEKDGYSTENLVIETNSKNQPHIELRISFICQKEN